MTQKETSYVGIINSVATVVTATIALLLPVIFLTNTIDLYTFPKQILVVGGAFLLLLLYCIKSLIERRITFVKNPLNLPIFIFAVVITVSTYISPSFMSSIPQTMPVVAAIIMFFAIVNLINEKQNFQIVLYSLIGGTLLGALLTIFASFQLYILPFEQTRDQFFNPMGSPVQMIGFLTPIIILSIATFLIKFRKYGQESLKKGKSVFYGITFLVLFITIGVIVYNITVLNETPVLLPFEHGFQIALKGISNEARFLPSFLFGAGYGMFSTVFTKFHASTLNALPSWNLTFAFSSSYALELIATTGILGIISYLFIIVRFIRSHSRMAIRPLFLAVASILALSFLIPFSFVVVALMFMLFALYIVNLKISNRTKSVDEIVVSVVTNGGLLEFNQPSTRKSNLLLPIVLTALAVAFIAYFLFFWISRGEIARGFYHYVVADTIFAKSLQQETLTSGGQQTYDLQSQAVEMYPYRADFHRIRSQISLAFATNLVNSQNDSPTVSQDVQQGILNQLQQAINSARQAVVIAPESSLNWRNLGQIYRNLIGVGQDAEQFAIASYNQAIVLDPNNPALRIELGGIYYQLGEYDLAQSQFQVAVNLKPDYANAYYNLGHALEEKGELASALQQYQIVRQLVQNDQDSLELIDQEIQALQSRIGSEQTPESEEDIEPVEEDTELDLQEQGSQFPERDPREEIPGPPSEDEEDEEEGSNSTTPSPTIGQ